MTLHLVPAAPEFAQVYHRWRDEKDLKRFNPQRSLSMPELTARLTRAGHDVIGPPVDEYRWFLLTDAGVPVATVSLKSVNWAMGHAEIGYHVGEAFQRQGHGREACRMLVEKVFRETMIERLLAFIHTENAASIRLAESLGFKLEGTFRGHVIIDGRRVDQHVYAKLKRS